MSTEVYVQITATVWIHLAKNISATISIHLRKYVTALLLCVHLKLGL